MTQLIDIHTHHNTENADAIISVEPTSFNAVLGKYYSVGIHPWNSSDITSADLDILQKVCRHTQVVAIGETGVDLLRGASKEKQIDLLAQHIKLSETLHKPLILHVVKSTDTILSLYKQYKPTQKWIIHGYRGNETTALQLIEKGIELSFGEKFNPQAVISTPLDQLWIESDESTTPIETIYNNIATVKNIDSHILKSSIYNRAQNLFFSAY